MHTLRIILTVYEITFAQVIRLELLFRRKLAKYIVLALYPAINDTVYTGWPRKNCNNFDC